MNDRSEPNQTPTRINDGELSLTGRESSRSANLRIRRELLANPREFARELLVNFSRILANFRESVANPLAYSPRILRESSRIRRELSRIPRVFAYGYGYMSHNDLGPPPPHDPGTPEPKSEKSRGQASP